MPAFGIEIACSRTLPLHSQVSSARQSLLESLHSFGEQSLGRPHKTHHGRKQLLMSNEARKRARKVQFGP